MRIALIVGFTIILSGCPNTYQLNSLSDSQPLTQPAQFNHPGPLRHDASELEFQELYDNFQRVAALRYDSAGLDVSISYNDQWSNCKIYATFYIYPTPRMNFFGSPQNVVSSITQGWLNDEFGRTKVQVKLYHPLMQSEVVDSVTTPAQGKKLNGYSLSYRETGNISELRLFVYNLKWFLKYRFTYPESCNTEANPRLEKLIHQLPWAAAQ
ncbi:MAG: hypothetical protein OEM27_04055 [Nitrospinota bacterium]|nr:hypothetical protein [Nitrospinota bacterium]